MLLGMPTGEPLLQEERNAALASVISRMRRAMARRRGLPPMYLLPRKHPPTTKAALGAARYLPTISADSRIKTIRITRPRGKQDDTVQENTEIGRHQPGAGSRPGLGAWQRNAASRRHQGPRQARRGVAGVQPLP